MKADVLPGHGQPNITPQSLSGKIILVSCSLVSREPFGPSLSDTNNRLAFDLKGAYSYSSIAAATLSGHADSWGIRWYWQVYRRDGLVLYPHISLVWVGGGLDSSGRHIKDSS